MPLSDKILDERLNGQIRDFSDDGSYEISGLEDSGKSIPYVGWYWRDVDFNNVILGDCQSGQGFIGFMENNKWGYAEINLTRDESRAIRKMLKSIVRKGAKDIKKKLQTLFDHLQTFKDEKYSERWSERIFY